MLISVVLCTITTGTTSWRKLIASWAHKSHTTEWKAGLGERDKVEARRARPARRLCCLILAFSLHASHTPGSVTRHPCSALCSVGWLAPDAILPEFQADCPPTLNTNVTNLPFIRSFVKGSVNGEWLFVVPIFKRGQISKSKLNNLLVEFFFLLQVVVQFHCHINIHRKCPQRATRHQSDVDRLLELVLSLDGFEYRDLTPSGTIKVKWKKNSA